MAAASRISQSCCYIVAVPFRPGPRQRQCDEPVNHLPLRKYSARRSPFVVTEEWPGLPAPPFPCRRPGVRPLRAYPQRHPSEHGRASDHAGFLDAVAAERWRRSSSALLRLASGKRRGGRGAPGRQLRVLVVGVGDRRARRPGLLALPHARLSFFAAYITTSLTPPAVPSMVEHAAAAEYRRSGSSSKNFSRKKGKRGPSISDMLITLL
ncbi:hypothetical protein ZWY2020_005394 [Hordeum vulgare]|nr:hypothetical protein ZWY2020_005394 [Hordeum vulgare]